MKRESPGIRDFAERLLASESDETTETTMTPPLFRVCEKLRSHLDVLMGPSGFRALLARALALAKQDEPWLKTVQIKPDGGLEGVGSPLPQEDSAVRAGSLTLIFELIGLLVTFIGANLTTRILAQIWPEIPISNLGFGTGGINETGK